MLVQGRALHRRAESLKRAFDLAHGGNNPVLERVIVAVFDFVMALQPLNCLIDCLLQRHLGRPIWHEFVQ